MTSGVFDNFRKEIDFLKIFWTWISIVRLKRQMTSYHIFKTKP